MAVTIHVAISVLVLQSFIRNEQRWSWYALGLHMLMDFVNPVVIPMLAPDGMARTIAETLALTLFGLIALAPIIQLRQPATAGIFRRQARVSAT